MAEGLSLEVRAVLNEALKMAKAEGFIIWGFFLGETSMEFGSFNNNFASRAGMIGMTENALATLADHNIRTSEKPIKEKSNEPVN